MAFFILFYSIFRWIGCLNPYTYKSSICQDAIPICHVIYLMFYSQRPNSTPSRRSEMTKAASLHQASISWGKLFLSAIPGVSEGSFNRGRKRSRLLPDWEIIVLKEDSTSDGYPANDT